MNSRDILEGFFADGAFTEACTRDKFRRECASSLDPEIAHQLYDLVSEQHGKTVERVLKNVKSGSYLPEPQSLENWNETVRNSVLQQSSTSVSELVHSLEEAVQSSEAQAQILQSQIESQLLEARNRKVQLGNAIREGKLRDLSVTGDMHRSAEKCIAVLQKKNGMNS